MVEFVFHCQFRGPHLAWGPSRLSAKCVLQCLGQT